MKTTLKFLALLIGLTAMGCTDRSKDEPKDQLPPITQSGANTAGCLVDGKIVVPKNSFLTAPTVFGLSINISNYTPGYYIGIYNVEEKKRLYIYVSKQEQIGDFTVYQSNGLGAGASQNSTQIFLDLKDKKYLSYDNSGIVKITKYNYPIVSGSFSAILYNKDNPSEKIQIADGRFDINVATLNK